MDQDIILQNINKDISFISREIYNLGVKINQIIDNLEGINNALLILIKEYDSIRKFESEFIKKLTKKPDPPNYSY